jgi:putative DNA primase/helicase
MSNLRAIARALGGEVVGGQVSCPGPGHSPRDRSLRISLDPNAPVGFIVHSLAGDDWRLCRDHVRARIGLPRERDPRQHGEAHRRSPERRPEGDDHEMKIASALALWSEGIDPRGTLAERYLASRGLDLGDDIAGDVLRWHTPTGAMLALFRDMRADTPKAVSRTFLDRDGTKIERKFLGPVRGSAVKLDSDENVLGGLHIGEGIETCLAARQFGLKPAWALGSKSAIRAFPVTSGVEALTIYTEPDAEREIETCATRWDAAGREVLINRAIGGKDLNDALRNVCHE